MWSAELEVASARVGDFEGDVAVGLIQALGDTLWECGKGVG